MKFKLAGRSPAEMPFLDHLEELRWRILWSLIALAVGTGIGFVVVTKFDVIGILKRPLDPLIDSAKLIALSPTTPFIISLKLALAFGAVLAFPIIVYQAWVFLSPALMPRERRAIVPSLYLGLVLFAGGVALGYFLVLPFTLKFMLSFQVDSIQPTITADAYFGYVTILLLAFGGIFELPVVVLLLSALGLVSSTFLRAQRRFAVAGGGILACLITPADLVSSLFMWVPLLLLYELSIGLARLVERGRARAEASEASEALPEAT